ncbi:MAG: hypothetical protein Dbin4_01004, partial [Alphaproteobacteria bacterium]|nr:hypothetical protein [Alphaproteobacteria bacterium]
TKKWAWDTTAMRATYIIPDYKDRTQEGYYSIFQIHDLDLVLGEMTRKIELDAFLDCKTDKKTAWQIKGDRWMQDAEERLKHRTGDEYCRSVPLLCQYISNRYYPQTQSDQRTIMTGGTFSARHWITLNGDQWDWRQEVREWDPQVTARLFDLTPEKLRHAYKGLASAQSHCDPLEEWYQLTQFIALDKRGKLKGDALRAETLRSGAHMLRLLHKDLYDEDLPHPNEVYRTIITHVPELKVRQDVRRYLEFVSNDFGINPQPKLALIVEGESEEIAIRKIFSEYFGIHPGTLAIEIIVLGGVNNATGGKEDRFRAIFRLLDYLHHHQTFTFIILDNENNAGKLKFEARKAMSIHSDHRHVTRPEYIRLWKVNFEFDNFSCTEIAAAMNQLANGYGSFSGADIAACKKDISPGSCLTKLYKKKTNYGLKKAALNEILVAQMLSDTTRRKIESRPIIKILERVERLAARNPFPVMEEMWERNQASQYFGKKIKQKVKRKK